MPSLDLPKKPFPFTELPLEIQLKMLDFLPPELLVFVGLVNKDLYFKTSDRILWQNKLARHFPHLNFNGSNSYDTFCENYQKNYLQSWGRFFSDVKESDAESLKQQKIMFGNICRHDEDDTTILNWDLHDTSNISILDWALKTGSQNILDWIYEITYHYYLDDNQNIAVNKRDAKNQTILYWAIITDQDKAKIKYLLSIGSQLSERYTSFDTMPIHVALHHFTLFQFLLELDASLLEAKDGKGLTPLLLAAKDGRIDAVSHLIHKNANVNAFTSDVDPSNRGKTPLHWAAEKGHLKVVELLLDAGVRLSLTEHMQYEPIHLAAISGHDDVVKLLLEKYPASCDAKDSYQQTPLLLAAAKGHTEMVRFLISINADVDARTIGAKHLDDRKTCLHWAAKGGHIEILKLLIKAGADTEARDDLGKTPLEYVDASMATKIRVFIYANKIKHDMNFKLFNNMKIQVPNEELRPAIKALKKVAFGKAGSESIEKYEDVFKDTALDDVFKSYRPS